MKAHWRDTDEPDVWELHLDREHPFRVGCSKDIHDVRPQILPRWGQWNELTNDGWETDLLFGLKLQPGVERIVADGCDSMGRYWLRFQFGGAFDYHDTMAAIVAEFEYYFRKVDDPEMLRPPRLKPTPRPSLWRRLWGAA